MKNSIIVPKEVPINQVELHPTILSLIPLNILMRILQGSFSSPTLKSAITLPVFLSKKKGGRKYEKFIITHQVLPFLFAKKLQIEGELVTLKAVLVEPLEDKQIVDNFIMELMGFRRSQETHAVMARTFQKVETSKFNKKEPPLMNASLKDVLAKRSHTLRDLSGYDGRAFKNLSKSKELNQDVKGFLEGFL